MKTTMCLVILAALVFAGCSQPTGPITTQQRQSLTNAVEQITSAPITGVEQMDTNVMLVTTAPDATGQGRDLVMERTRRGWKSVSSVTK